MFHEFLLMFLIAISAGFIGALVGLGGGLIIVPALTLLFHVPIHIAIAASIVTVIATSISGAHSYVKQEIANVRLGMFLEISTTVGALVGAFLSVMMHGWMLSLIFGVLILYMSVITFRSRKTDDTAVADRSGDSGGDRLSRTFGLNGVYHDESAGVEVEYEATRVVGGSLVASLAGLGSGMLGIGGGVVKVAAMNSMMKLPIKVSVATSQFMIGVTAATGAVVYLLAGAVDLYVVVPIALGAMVGARVGSRVMNRLPGGALKIVFFLLMLYFGYGMVASGLAVKFAIHLPGVL